MRRIANENMQYHVVSARVGRYMVRGCGVLGLAAAIAWGAVSASASDPQPVVTSLDGGTYNAAKAAVGSPVLHGTGFTGANTLHYINDDQVTADGGGFHGDNNCYTTSGFTVNSDTLLTLPSSICGTFPNDGQHYHWAVCNATLCSSDNSPGTAPAYSVVIAETYTAPTPTPTPTPAPTATPTPTPAPTATPSPAMHVIVDGYGGDAATAQQMTYTAVVYVGGFVSALVGLYAVTRLFRGSR